MHFVSQRHHDNHVCKQDLCKHGLCIQTFQQLEHQAMLHKKNRNGIEQLNYSVQEQHGCSRQ
jgi:hypothetical protein